MLDDWFILIKGLKLFWIVFRHLSAARGNFDLLLLFASFEPPRPFDPVIFERPQRNETASLTTQW
jgi:hypothetical protein